MSRPAPKGGTASSVTIDSALANSAPLASLMARLRESLARLEAIAPLLPAALRPSVHAGPVDPDAWTLLADNPACATKLRQMIPQLEAELVSRGWPRLDVRVRVRRG